MKESTEITLAREPTMSVDRNGETGAVDSESSSTTGSTTTTTTTRSKKEKKNGGNNSDSTKPSIGSSASSTACLIVPSVPLISIKHGRQQKRSSLDVQNWIALALTLDGRDKLTKVLQYACRTLSWWYAIRSARQVTNNNNSSGSYYYAAQSERFAEAKAALTNGRKAFRLGRTLIELHRLYTMILQLSKSSSSTKSSNRQSSSCDLSKPSLRSTLSFMSFESPWIDSVGSAIKLLGLAGFWGADNASYLAQMGLLDDYSQTKQQRIQSRSKRQATCSAAANRSYFAGALAGLVVNVRAYLRHRRAALIPLVTEEQKAEKDGDDVDTRIAIRKRIDQAHRKQFVNGMALLKSCCDVLVFSNNPGVDLWKRGFVRGLFRTTTSSRNQPMHEGLHCLCGLISAATVLYNNFPDDDDGDSNK
jgi:Peroxisomal biogenesis factor 11 (PEX11)